MKMEYRILHTTGGNFYPQVRTRRFFIWSKWERIVRFKYENGDMFATSNTTPPFYQTKEECEYIIELYHNRANTSLEVISQKEIIPYNIEKTV